MNQTTTKKITYWLKVAVVGITLGFGLQFVRAWTEPTEAPPGGNVGAPINTGGLFQGKEAGLMINGMGYSSNGLLVPYGNVGIGTVSPGQKLDVAGGVKIGNVTSVPPTPTPTAAGTIRWNGTDFEGYNGETWKSFTATGGGSSSAGSKLFTPDTSDNTWTAPVGVTKIKVTAIGGGGGCGDSSGGGSGGFASAFLTPEPGATYSVEIGGRGTCNNDYAGAPDAKPGKPTKLIKGGSVLVSAEGGKGAINFTYPLGGPTGCGQGGEAGAGCIPSGNGRSGTWVPPIPDGPAGYCTYGAGGVCPVAGSLSFYGTGGNGGSNDASGVGDAKSGALLLEWW